jgi:hypothetical protein
MASLGNVTWDLWFCLQGRDLPAGSIRIPGREVLSFLLLGQAFASPIDFGRLHGFSGFLMSQEARIEGAPFFGVKVHGTNTPALGFVQLVTVWIRAELFLGRLDTRLGELPFNCSKILRHGALTQGWLVPLIWFLLRGECRTGLIV